MNSRDVFLRMCSWLQSEWRMEVLKRLPTLKKLDGKDVTDDELEAAAAS